MRLNLAKRYPEGILDIINQVGNIADRKGISAYIVGGPVRDLLLRVSSDYDLDFVIEGDAIQFARDLNKMLKGDLKIHKPFGTTTIGRGAYRIDIATARSESYRKPAAYPDVIPSSIKEDLFRRDFTINAMAIVVNKNDFGKLLDFYGGLRDLKRGIIRVMHTRSFIDDPSRIFRAVRFAVRLNFKIESGTKRLMKEAILNGLLGELNRGRIKKEIELFLSEKDPLGCLNMFAKLI